MEPGFLLDALLRAYLPLKTEILMAGISRAERERRDRLYERGLKQCNTCSEPLPLADFTPRHDGYRGLNGSCRLCCNAKTLDWQRRNPERVAGRVRTWCQENRPARLAIERRYATRLRWRQEGTVAV